MSLSHKILLTQKIPKVLNKNKLKYLKPNLNKKQKLKNQF